MAWVPAERRREEEANHLQGLFLGMHPSPDADHIGVVVLAAELGGVQVVRERRSGADHLVCRDLLAVA